MLTVNGEEVNLSGFKVGDAVCVIPNQSRETYLRKLIEAKKHEITKYSKKEGWFTIETELGDYGLNAKCLIHWDAATPAQRAGLCVGDYFVIGINRLKCQLLEDKGLMVVFKHPDHGSLEVHYENLIGPTRLLDSPKDKEEIQIPNPKAMIDYVDNAVKEAEEKTDNSFDPVLFWDNGRNSTYYIHRSRNNYELDVELHRKYYFSDDDLVNADITRGLVLTPGLVGEQEPEPLSTREQAFADKQEHEQLIKQSKAIVEANRIQRRDSAVLSAMAINDRPVSRNGK